jgi:hypothetical protein
VSETPAVTTPKTLEPISVQPSLELWVALGISAIPQLLAAFIGGYGHVIVIVPLALAATLADIAAAAVAALQLRSDRDAQRSSHPVVWITLGLAALWLLYALAVGLIALVVHVFCVNELCRGPLR